MRTDEQPHSALPFQFLRIFVVFSTRFVKKIPAKNMPKRSHFLTFPYYSISATIHDHLTQQQQNPKTNFHFHPNKLPKEIFSKENNRAAIIWNNEKNHEKSEGKFSAFNAPENAVFVEFLSKAKVVVLPFLRRLSINFDYAQQVFLSFFSLLLVLVWP